MTASALTALRLIGNVALVAGGILALMLALVDLPDMAVPDIRRKRKAAQAHPAPRTARNCPVLSSTLASSLGPACVAASGVAPRADASVARLRRADTDRVPLPLHSSHDSRSSRPASRSVIPGKHGPGLHRRLAMHQSRARPVTQGRMRQLCRRFESPAPAALVAPSTACRFALESCANCVQTTQHDGNFCPPLTETTHDLTRRPRGRHHRLRAQHRPRHGADAGARRRLHHGARAQRSGGRR